MGQFFKPSYTEYLQDSQLKNLRLYKYGAVDKSPITKYVLRPYWDYAITLFPRWIAPNLITLIGLFFMIFNVILACIFIPDLSTEGPSWVYFSFALGLWLYSTFDNVDGRQARRTNTSSPLGELFDHGCDAINCTYVAILQAAALGLGHSVSAAILLYVTVAGFYMSTAEEYYTGVLYLGYVNGPTEGIIVTCLAFIWTGLYGPDSWHVPISEVAWFSWLSSFLPVETTFANLFIYGLIFFFLTTQLPVSIYAINKACHKKSMNATKALVDVLGPFLLCTIIIYLWLRSPGSTIFIEEHYILFSVFVGYLFGEMASDIILAHLTKSTFPKFKSIYYSLGVGLLFSLLGYFDIYYIRATAVINAFCDFLGIQCFKIPPSKYVERSILPTRIEIETDNNQEVETLLVNEQPQQEQEYRTF
ncbi:hypothetical protein G6F57_008371 [Rhizopus arrhizus]|uniref:Choline/ethanolaminephosphotransferase n=1 Tax=Rhizopus oryzae TaxID=64495 RepID=A0A9P7BUM8_RHIOR|nr:hypothetical protein G6F23_011851 [Rhizopus arrhizus]KAG1414291.1 hypothetical protein G6F58_007023 [Rhizopus delemar]KAG0758675.1 hypothetical protein G6F24_009630 [Rhizopus arrhizus]KAG0795134.1 hypothetical protein G6F21_002337 [Rhizopus arrhizus]KAG0814373.1 hypothetical protein G6F20_004830 [Rhizopus arrhizus]